MKNFFPCHCLLSPLGALCSALLLNAALCLVKVNENVAGGKAFVSQKIPRPSLLRLSWVTMKKYVSVFATSEAFQKNELKVISLPKNFPFGLRAKGKFFSFSFFSHFDSMDEGKRKVSLPFSCACQIEQFVGGMKVFTTNFF
jgi:hypothetical protein